MHCPQKTDIQFDTTLYSLFIGSYYAVQKPICNKYGISMTDCRILCAIGALISMYDYRIADKMVSVNQLFRLTSFANHKVIRRLVMLEEKGYIVKRVDLRGRRKFRRYKLSKRGAEVVNKLASVEVVNERIVEHLYRVRLLK